MHAFFRGENVSALQKAQFTPEHLPEPAMPPAEAARHLVRNNVDYLPIDEIEGRVAPTLFVVYPPGIATIVPGERLGARARPMVDYLKAFERSSNLFPGFETEIQGVYREVDAARARSGSTLMWCVSDGIKRFTAPSPNFHDRAIDRERHDRERQTADASPSRDEDVEAMLVIYRHHIARGVDPSLHA